MRRLVLALLIATVCSGQPLPSFASGCGSREGASSLSKGLLTWINTERKSRGLAAYRISPDLNSAAGAHACDMVKHDYFAHRRPDGPDLRHRIKATGYPLSIGAENIAYTQQRKVASVASIWKNSPQHWHAILDPNLRDIGIALAESPNGEGPVYWVMDVGRKR